ncbi:hypothetical protein Y032_0014g2513 [Ancylostoma ceylanicum]|uniref:Uncharacterized protein n=1 Tax=Ancylostoma ceylanicum TaxID=53326 RepID=A0A016VBP3_9BILA|nr:hypothetical protein Y032_0014g2513 [Ancylostoma ceylanicum]
MEPPHQPTASSKQHFYSQPTPGRVRPATLRLSSHYRRIDTRRRNGPAGFPSSRKEATDLLTPPLQRSPRQRRAPDRLNVNPAKNTYS